MSSTSRGVSVTLRVGVIASFLFLLAGIVLQWGSVDEVELLHPLQLSHTFQQFLRGDPIATIHIGLLLLMLTPLARVVILMIEFLRNREFSFAAISVGVLLLLAVSAVVGLS